MPRLKVKKRKHQFYGVQKQDISRVSSAPNDCPRPRPSTSTESRPSPVGDELTEPKSSASKRKVSSNLDSYDKYTDDDKCNDIINLFRLEKLMENIAVCRKCGGSLSIVTSDRLGLSVTVTIKCNDCDYEVSAKNSEKLSGGRMEVNVRSVYAFRCIGKGEQAAKTLCAVMNLPRPITFKRYNKLLCSAAKEVCTNTMVKAAEESVVENDGDSDITAIFDGSWQRRGHQSLNGVVTAIAANTGKVVDVRILSKFCRCKKRVEYEHDMDRCEANYNGSSGNMEVAGVVDMFLESQRTRGVRYKQYLGDGDSAAFPTVLKEDPYGPECQVEKLECVGHVRKRMGTRLRTLKTVMGKKELQDGKTIGGRGRLTNVIIDEIQTYYGLAIQRNTNSLDKMKQAVWSTYFHLMSSNESPAHGLCPKGSDTWCKYHKAMAEGKPYDHKAHTHLPKSVMEAIKPIFKDLSNDQLLRRCLHGGTQNPSESLNNVIWSRVPKTTFVMKTTLDLGVYEAIASYNMGNIVKCLVLEKCGVVPGSKCVREMKNQDEIRIKKAEKSLQEIEKKCRKALAIAKKRLEDEYEAMEDPDNPSYGAGMH